MLKWVVPARRRQVVESSGRHVVMMTSTRVRLADHRCKSAVVLIHHDVLMTDATVVGDPARPSPNRSPPRDPRPRRRRRHHRPPARPRRRRACRVRTPGDGGRAGPRRAPPLPEAPAARPAGTRLGRP
ncbi:hypothetical protein FRIGORI9N_540003 [Frigoribacterium sp. 9N]|nr:hypothetical protein FRIGORI9N_540003 [Frigoribacterium sp. 9N]